MENPVKKDDAIVRAALYLEYDGKCFYEGLPIRFQDMHIDHIIPELLVETEELTSMIDAIGLPKNFNLNSLYNLVPCSPNVNQVKNKKQYPIEFLAHCIHLRTTKKVEKIKARIERPTNEYKLDKDLARLVAKLNEFNDKKKLEELYNSLSKEQPFPIFRNVYKGQSRYNFERSLPNVRLSGFIPQYPRLEGSCLITFSNLRLRDCMITLNHKQIMERLFEGIKTELELNLRDYIIHSDVIDSKIYYVDLGNVRIPLEREEVQQLIKIVDDFFDIYFEQCRRLYFLLNRDMFSKSTESNHLRLVKISKHFWSRILIFCREFDYDLGNSEWNIFDSGGSFIKVYYKDEEEFKAFVFPEFENSKFIVPTLEDIWLVWTDEYFWKKEIGDLECNKIWTPIYTYRWLVNQLIPYVVYHNSKKKKEFLGKKISYSEFIEGFNISEYTSYLLDDKVDDFDLLTYLNRIQLFYSTYKDDYYCGSDLTNLYESLKVILESSDIDLSGLEYVKSKLHVGDAYDKKTVLSEINKTIDRLNNGRIYSSFTIDLVFRCMIVSLRDYGNNLSEFEINSLKYKLDIFNEKRIIDDIRKNY